MALPALSPPFTSRYFPVSCAAGRYTFKLKLFGCLLNPSHEKQNDKDDQDDADESDATVTIPVPIAAEAATESTEQEDYENDNEDESGLFRTVHVVLNRSSRIEEDLIDQLFNSSEKRLARLLLLLANFGKEGRPEPIVGNFSQETLAEMIGTTRSRVSFFMNKFRKLGFIEYNGKLEVHNSLLNVVLHDKPEIKTRDEAIDAE
jgi:hypothetical protein